MCFYAAYIKIILILLNVSLIRRADATCSLKPNVQSKNNKNKRYVDVYNYMYYIYRTVYNEPTEANSGTWEL